MTNVAIGYYIEMYVMIAASIIFWFLLFSQLLVFRFTPRRRITDVKITLLCAGAVATLLHTVRTPDINCVFGVYSQPTAHGFNTQETGALLDAAALVILFNARSLATQINRHMPRWISFLGFIPALYYHISSIVWVILEDQYYTHGIDALERIDIFKRLSFGLLGCSFLALNMSIGFQLYSNVNGFMMKLEAQEVQHREEAQKEAANTAAMLIASANTSPQQQHPHHELKLGAATPLQPSSTKVGSNHSPNLTATSHRLLSPILAPKAIPFVVTRPSHSQSDATMDTKLLPSIGESSSPMEGEPTTAQQPVTPATSMTPVPDRRMTTSELVTDANEQPGQQQQQLPQLIASPSAVTEETLPNVVPEPRSTTEVPVDVGLTSTSLAAPSASSSVQVFQIQVTSATSNGDAAAATSTVPQTSSPLQAGGIRHLSSSSNAVSLHTAGVQRIAALRSAIRKMIHLQIWMTLIITGAMAGDMRIYIAYWRGDRDTGADILSPDPLNYKPMRTVSIWIQVIALCVIYWYSYSPIEVWASKKIRQERDTPFWTTVWYGLSAHSAMIPVGGNGVTGIMNMQQENRRGKTKIGAGSVVAMEMSTRGQASQQMNGT